MKYLINSKVDFKILTLFILCLKGPFDDRG